MNPEEQRMAIARATGVLYHDFIKVMPDGNRQCNDCCMFEREDPYNECPIKEAPDYLNNRDAMAEAVATLKTKKEREAFVRELQIVTALPIKRITDDEWLFRCVTATAGQLAETFLRAKGLWKD